jgi:hypothetical protein
MMIASDFGDFVQLVEFVVDVIRNPVGTLGSCAVIILAVVVFSVIKKAYSPDDNLPVGQVGAAEQMGAPKLPAQNGVNPTGHRPGNEPPPMNLDPAMKAPPEPPA